MTGYDPRYGFELNYGAVPPAVPRVPFRKRRWVRAVARWTAVVLLVTGATLAGLRWYWGYEAQQAVDLRTAALDRVDPHWRWDDMQSARPAVPEEQNAARLVTAAARRVTPDWPNRPATPGGALPGFQPSGEFNVAPWHERFDDVATAFRMEDAIAADMRTELAALASALAEARRLIDGPGLGRFDVEWQRLPAITALPHTERVRAVATLLRYDAVLRAHDGQLDDALASCRGVLAVGRALGDEPTTGSQQMRIGCHHTAVRLAERILAQGEVAPEALRATHQLFVAEAADSRRLYINALRADRGQIFEFLGRIVDGDNDVEQLQPLPADRARWQERATEWVIGRHRIRFCQATALDLLTAGIQALELRPDQQQASLGDLEDQARAFLVEYEALGTAVNRLFPNFPRAGWIIWRDRATLQAVELALAAERHRLAHGRWPQTLDELVPEYIAAVPEDPFGAGPFKLRRLESGLVIYSVGPDGVDNEGRIIRAARYRGEGDIGFQLWDPERRGRLPLPPTN